MSAIGPETTMAAMPTAAPATCTKRKVLVDWLPNRVIHPSGKMVTRWNMAKLASGTKAPIRISRP